MNLETPGWESGDLRQGCALGNITVSKDARSNVGQNSKVGAPFILLQPTRIHSGIISLINPSAQSQVLLLSILT